MSYIFIKTNDPENRFDLTEEIKIVSLENGMVLSDLVDIFRSFLLASGYSPDTIDSELGEDR